MVVVMVPAAFALSGPVWGDWGELAANYTGVYSISFSYTPDDTVKASGVYLKSANNAYILTGADDNTAGAGTVWPEELVARYVDDYNNWQGEYAISLFVTSDDDWLNNNEIDTSAATATTATGKFLVLQERTAPSVSGGATMQCTWEQGDFGAYSERLTIDFDGTFEQGWYFCKLSYPDNTNPDYLIGGETFWLRADENGKLTEYTGASFDTNYGEDVSGIPTGAPKLELRKVDTVLSSDKAKMTMSISPFMAFTGTANPNAPSTPPTATDPEVTVEEVALTTDVADDISSEDQSALNAVLSNAAITGMKNALNETSVDKIVQASGVSTTDADEIKVQLKAALTVTAADLDKGTISFEVAPTAKVTAGSETQTVSVDNSYLNGKNITVKLPIPAEFIPKEILHISKGKPVEQYLLNNGFTVKDGTAVLYIDHFSELRMNESQTTVAKIEGSDTGYFSLQSAIDAAGSDAKINLYNNSDDTVLKVANKSLTINCNTYKLRSDVDWQLTNCTKSETTDDQNNPVIVITYTGGGSSSGGGGGSSSSSNKPTASVSGSGGKVTVASDGTVTITPDAGYQIAKITVNGKEVDIPANGKLTGLDKDDKVVVTFEKIPEEKPDESTTPFTDVAENAWYADAVQYVYEKGIMNGTSATSFSPNDTTTRGMIVTMLHRLEDTPSAVSSGFTDVAAGAWYADAVAWAAANGVVNGISDSSFAPETAITREQLATILYRYAQLKGYDVSVSGDLSGYADASQISEYAITAMQWANENGLITGNTATTLNPQGNATRAEVATILMRFIENMG